MNESSKREPMIDDNPLIQSEITTLAGGCFWGMEEIIRQIPGVIQTVVGYTGGMTLSPTYQQVRDGSRRSSNERESL